MSKTIAVYSEGQVSTGSLFYRLKQSFGAAAVRPVTAAQMRGGALEDAAALFLPGVQDDSQTYRDRLTPETCGAIASYVEKGGTSIGLCAGAYISARRFHYTNRINGLKKTIDSPLAFFDGEAFGPIARYSRSGDDSHRWSNHAVAHLAFNEAAGHHGEGRACYALGPWLELSDEARKDPDYRIIARYADVPGTPVAVASRKIGKGKAVFCGVLPEISGLDMPHTSERMSPGAPHLDAGRAFARDLARHEAARQKVWNALLAEIG